MLTKIQNVKISYISRVLALPIIAITVFAFTLRTKAVEMPLLKLDKTFTVIIDAGHGIMENGKANGVTVDGVSEDNIVLAIANKIKELNNNDNLKVVLTRASDKIVDLHKRVDIAKENNADLFLSIHINAAPAEYKDSVGMNGMEVMVSNKNTVYQKESELIGSVLQQELNSIYPVKPFLVKRKVGAWVLDQNVCPSVLIECGYLTDEKDREFITKENNQTAVAQKILAAIANYALNKQEATTSIADTVSAVQMRVKDVVLQNSQGSSKGNSKKAALNLNTENPPLYFVNGKEVSKSDVEKIDVATIESISVLKGASAIKEYGKKGMNGAVLIQLKKTLTLSEVTLKEVRVDTVPRKDNQNKVKEIFIDGQKLKAEQIRSSPITWEQAKKSKQPIVVDDKLVQSIDDVNPSDIVSVSIGQGTPLVKEYGDKAALGVIFITTKNYKRTGAQPIFQKVEIEASVNRNQWQSHLARSLRPAIEKASAEGMKPGTYAVQVKFLVFTDGSLTDVQALNDPGFNLAAAAIKAVKTGPKWNPGINNRKPVNSYHVQPIIFVISDGGKKNTTSKIPEIRLSNLRTMAGLDMPNLKSFTIVAEVSNGDLYSHPNKGARFDEQAKALWSNIKIGSILTFENIVAIENGVEVKKSALVYRVV